MEFLTGICTTIVGEIAKVTIAPVGRQLGYLFYYQRNIDNLRKKIEDLNDKKTSIDLQVKEAANRDEEAEEKVNKWQAEAEKSFKEAADFLNDERHHKAKCSCRGSLWSRHQLSRKSNKMEKTIASIIENANSLENCFHRRPVKCPFANRGFVTFDTRTLAFKKIMDAVEDPYCNRIGVYGTGGVGKTTLVKEVGQKAQEKGLFSDVVMVTVSQPVVLERIQEKIVEMLNLKLDDKSMEARASRLRHRLEGQGRVLLILDDIWEKLDLEAIGIYSREDRKGSKILFVSRDRHLLCNDMNVEKDIKVEDLSEEEAMKLFNKYVGHTTSDREFKDLATKIVGRCGGLPIAIETIACALKNRDIHVWRDALVKLKRSPKEGYGKAYSSIKTSYDFLTSDQERMILLLCSLHEEDANINVKDLTNIYSAYSDMFVGVTTLKEETDSVRTLIDNLRGRSLLLNGDYDGTIKLHDVVRQIMYSIASEDNNMVCFENFTSLKNDLNQEKLKDTTAISLLGPDFDQLPNDLACPKLKLLMRQSRKYSVRSERVLVPKGFLEEVKELRALCLYSVTVNPSSLSRCSNLTTLILKSTVLEDVACIGELEKLVILDLSYSSKFWELPEQIGKLTCLHQLNLNHCTNLKVVRPNVISSLKQMEELYMDGVYFEWGMEAEVGGGQNADLAELVELRHLRALHLCILDASALQKHKLFDNENLEWYHIEVGRPSFPQLKPRSRLLHLELNEQSQFYECGFQRLIKEVEELCLVTVPGVENIVNHVDANGFPQLKKLGIEGKDPFVLNEIMEFHASSSVTSTGPLFHGKVAFPSLQDLELWDADFSELWPNGLPSTSCMKNLTSLRVEACNNLKYLFPFAIVGSFMQLEHLEIYNCAMMEEIIKESPGSSGNVLLPKLKYLMLISLQSLKRFCGGDCNMECESLLKIEIIACPQLETFSEKVPYFSMLSNMIFKDLQELEIRRCNNMTYLLSFAIVESLKQLKYVKIKSCDVMEHVIRKAIGEDGRLKKISFPKLEFLDLKDLPMLESFCEGVDFIECPSLLELKLRKCEKLRTFIPNSASTTLALTEDEQQAQVREFVTQQPLFNEKVVFSNLEDLWICYCGKDVNEIWPRQSSTLFFPKLKVLHLRGLANLMHLFDNPKNIQFMPQAVQPLETLSVYNCPGLKTLAASSYFSFENLTDVSISKCHGMTSLLDSSTAKSLEQLTRMSITKCGQLKHVIRTNHTLQDEFAEGDEIVFHRLKILAFLRLPSLESFRGGNNNMLELPSLERLIVSECPEMWTFSHGRINAPKLNRSIITEVWIWWPDLLNVQLWFEELERVEPEEEVILEGDLNRSIRKLWEENDPHIALQWLFSETTDVRILRKYRRR